MDITITHAAIDAQQADAVVIALDKEGIDERQFRDGWAARIDKLTDGALGRALSWERFEGGLGDVAVLTAPPNMAAEAVVVCGLGPRAAVDRGAVFRACSTGTRRLSGQPRESVAYFLPDAWDEQLQEAAVTAIHYGCVGQDLYRAEKKRHAFATVHCAGATAKSLNSGRILGESINLARRLVNEPPSEIYPEAFAAATQEALAAHGVEIEVWDETRLREERCGALTAVGQGSTRPPRLVIMRHRGGAPDAAALGLVGKGVTFDSGGLSLKTSEGMKLMKCDMAGAATVVGAMQAIARLQLPLNVVGVVGLVENLVSRDAYKLGDVLTARNGRTIEVLNTDAEGRLVLADALDVAVERGASKIIDLATLTGACVVALGMDVAGLMSNDQSWCDRIANAARSCGEPVWQLPMFDDYGKQIRSEVADIKNIGEGRWGGAITAAKFLEHFVGDTPWTHIDIAGPAFVEKTKPWSDGGGSGAYVRTLVDVARGWNEGL